MKKFLIIFGALIILLIAALAIVPVFFKDEIKSAIDEQLAATVDADILFEVDNFSLSVFPNFPNITAGISQFGVIGRNEFAGEILFATNEFEVEISLSKLLFGDQISITSILLDEPQIFIKVLPSGVANYDIMIEQEAVDSLPQETSGSEDFQIGIDHWEIRNGHIMYEDATMPMAVELKNLNHQGSGDFSLSVFDLTTTTSAYVPILSYDGTSYLSKKQLALEMTILMDMDQMKFTFTENRLSINDIGLGVDGWIAMPDEDIAMELSINALNNDFKSFMSLIPAIYSQDFELLEASGSFSIAGDIHGVYNDTSLPAFNIDVAIAEGMFQYPELPESVSNVNMNLNIANTDGIIEHTAIDLSSLHIDFGPNPIDMNMKVDNLINYPMKGEINAALDLAHLTKIFPVEGLNMAGSLEAQLLIDGIYDSTKAMIPKIIGDLALSSGLIDYTDLQAPISNLEMKADFANQSGKMADFKFHLEQFSAVFEGSPLEGNMTLENLDNYTWEAYLKGDFNFDKLFPIINRLYPLPGMTLGGAIQADLSTKGTYADLEAERYSKLSNSGGAVFNNFTYQDSLLLPEGLTITSGSVSFNPAYMAVAPTKILTGASDFTVKGRIDNYLNYVLEDNALLKGTMDLTSQQIDLNQWMVEPEPDMESVVEATPEENYSVIEVPKNIDFVFNAEVDKIIYENIILTNAKGAIIVKNGVVNLNGLRTNMLGGEVIFTGTYDTRDLTKPLFDMGLKVNEVSIEESYAAFSTVQILAPIAKHLKGNLTTDFNLNGVLKEDMTPDLTTLTGGGLMRIAEAVLGNSKIVEGLSKFTAANASDQAMTVKDILMTAEIKDGKFSVEPFDVKIKGYQANITGATSLDGSVDYDIIMDVPAGVLGSQVNALMGAFAGSQNNNENVKVNLNLAGTYDNPVISFMGADAKEKTQEVAKTQITKLAQGTGNEALVDTLQNIDFSQEAMDKEIAKQKIVADSIVQAQKDSLERAAMAEVDSAKKRALDEAANKINSFFKKKKKN
jgi:hypothetical protein